MAVYQDGTFPSGSPVLQINGVSYKCNSFTVDKSAETVQITDENGEHSGALSFKGPITGSAEVQFSASNVAEPTTAAANATTGVMTNVNIAGANVNCFITSVSVSKPQRGPWVASLGWQARVN